MKAGNIEPAISSGGRKSKAVKVSDERYDGGNACSEINWPWKSTEIRNISGNDSTVYVQQALW
jgi:hypothetical protein